MVACVELFADDRPVVLLTFREASALRAALIDWSEPAVMAADDGDLGRAWRVLDRQVEYVQKKYMPLGMKNGIAR